MALLLNNQVPLLNDIWEFARTQVFHEDATDEAERQYEAEMNAMADLCSKAINIPNISTRMPADRDPELIEKLSKLTQAFVIIRTTEGYRNVRKCNFHMWKELLKALRWRKITSYQLAQMVTHMLEDKEWDNVIVADEFMSSDVEDISDAISEYELQHPVERYYVNSWDKYVYTPLGDNPEDDEYIRRVNHLDENNRPLFQEMEEEATGVSDNLMLDRASNVLLTTTRQPSMAMATMPTVKWGDFVSNDVSSDYRVLTDRWYTLGAFEWNVNQKVGENLFNFIDKGVTRVPILPYDIVMNSCTKMTDMPNLIPFRVNTYWRGDIEVKIQVNSNKFQIGQLLACFYYQAHQNMNIKDKFNIYGLSQMDHAIIQASASNDANLYIPYNNVYPFLPTRPVPGLTSKQAVLNLGNLLIVVMNPLTTTSNGPKKCKVSVLCRFVNSEFTGMCHGALSAIQEMELATATVKGAETFINTLAGVRNQDNPSHVQQAPYIVPTASHNWSNGTNVVEPLHNLRLDPKGATQHPAACSAENTLTVSDITGKYGLIDQLVWMNERDDRGHRGTVLYKKQAHPAIRTKLDSSTRNDANTPYVLTPVGIISSMFAQWRGGLDFKFQIVASQFHTGRLMIGYIPGYLGDANIEKLKASPHAIFDLQEQREFTFEVPYISYRPWWPRENSGNYLNANSDPPSTLYVLIFNELVDMESIADRVYINVYLRGNATFEVSVPVQPSISLSWHKDFLEPNSDLTGAVSGYYPYYYGFWNGLNNSSSLVARYGPTAQQVAEFTPLFRGLPRDYVVIYRNIDKKDGPTVNLKSNAQQLFPEYAIITNSGHGYYICIPCLDKNSAVAAAKVIQIDKRSASSDQAVRCYYNAPDYAAGSYCKGNPRWSLEVVKATTPSVLDFEIVQQEGEEDLSPPPLSITTNLASTQYGMHFYGENYNDLMNLCRRYQLYGQLELKGIAEDHVNKCVLYFHALPQGLQPSIGVPAKINETFNRCREGQIPLIASLYRYYRGSLRFRIVFPCGFNASVWVQHRPDRKYQGEVDRAIRMCTEIDTAQGVFNHGYAYYVQVLNVNPIVEFEVPFYNNTCYNLLQQPDIIEDAHSWTVSLGQITVGIESSIALNKFNGQLISIYYSLADDFAFSNWIGGGQYLLLDNNTAEYSEKFYQEMEEESDIQPVASSTLITPAHRNDFLFMQQGPVDRMVEKVKVETKATIGEVVHENVQLIKEEISNTFKKVYDQLGDSITTSDKSTIAAILGNLMHIAINPVSSTIAMSIVNIIVSLGVLCVASISSAITIVKRIFQEIRSGVDTKQPQEESQPVQYLQEGPEDATGIAAWCSLLYNGCMSAFNVALKKPKSWLQWQQVLGNDLANSTRGANQIFIFLRNTVDCIKRMFDYILGRQNKDYQLLQLMETDPDVLKDWCKEVLYLIDPSVRREKVGNINYTNRVYDAQAFGQIILTDVSSEYKTDKNSAAIAKLYDKITLLKDELIELGEHPHVRKLPFTIYVVGEPGIGKSHCSTKVTSELLQSVHYKTNKGLKCTINPLSDYWDQCDHQPVLEIDDLWSVNTINSLEKQLNTVFQVCSPIVLSPPKAAVEEKKMRYNPEIFYINANNAFPTYNDVNSLALWRRRDILVQAIKSPYKIAKCPHCSGETDLEHTPPSYLDDMHHILFKVAKNVKDPNTEWTKPMPYDMFINMLKEKFQAFRVREQINFSNRVKDQEILADITDELNEDSILDKYQDLQERRALEYSLVKDRTLSNDVKELYDKMSARAKSTYNDTWDMTVKLKHKMKQSKLFCYFKQEMEKDTSSSRLHVSARVTEHPVGVTTSMVNAAHYVDYAQAQDELLNGHSSSGYSERLRQHIETNMTRDSVLIRDEISVEEAFFRNPQDPMSLNIEKMVTEGRWNKKYSRQLLDILKRLDDDGYILNDLMQHYDTLLIRIAGNVNTPELMKTIKDVPTMLDTFIKYAASTVKPYCNHFNKGIDCTWLSENHIMSNGIDNGQYKLDEPCGPACILQSRYLHYLWYKRWLQRYPCHRLSYDRKKLTHFPKYLQAPGTHSILKPDNIAKQFLLYLQTSWQKHCTPLIRKTLNWFSSIWPAIRKACEVIGALSLIAMPVATGTMVYKAFKGGQKNAAAATAAYIRSKGYDPNDKSWYDNMDAQKRIDFRTEMFTEDPLGSIAAINKGGEILKDNIKYANTPLNAIQQAPLYDAGTPKLNAVPKAQPLRVMQQSSQQCEAVARLVQNNTVNIKIIYGDHLQERNYRGLVIGGRKLLLLKHYWEDMKSHEHELNRTCISFEKNNTTRLNGCVMDIRLLECKMIGYGHFLEEYQMWDSNYILVDLPVQVPEFKDLTKFMAKWNDFKNLTNDGTLIEGGLRIRELQFKFGPHMPITVESQNGRAKSIYMENMFTYDIHAFGMCGSVLLCNNLERPIVGIHVAGSSGPNGYGIAEPIYQEIFTNIVPPETKPIVDIAEPILDLDSKSNEELGGILYNIGNVQIGLAHHQSCKTSIEPSLIHGVFEVHTEPNPMSINDPRVAGAGGSPLALGCSKHGQPNLALPSELVNVAYEHLNNKILSRVTPLRLNPSVVDMQTAVCGLPGIDEYNALSFTTSAGFPMAKLKPANAIGKHWLFKMHATAEGYHLDSVDQRLLQQIEVAQTMRARGIRPMTVFTDCLKDTCLPKEKCRIPGKTRIFSISPIQYTIPFRQYMLDFMASYRRARLNVNHAIGINVNSMDWTQLAMSIQKKGPKLVTGDYSNFGPALNSELAEKALQIIYNWYVKNSPQESATVRTQRAILLTELLNAYHLCGNRIYRVACGIPSGSPITDILNSLVGNLYIYCAWVAITGKNLSEYERHCYEVVYGDDLIMNVSDEISDVFNTVTLNAFFKKYLIKFTDTDKSGAIIPYHTLHDATFLKCGFKLHPTRPACYLASLDKVSIEGCANWIRPNKIDTKAKQTQENCVMTCNLAFGQGPEYFGMIRKTLTKALQDKGIFQPLPTWKELDERNFSTIVERSRPTYGLDEYYIIE